MSIEEKLDILDKLHWIENCSCIYNIHYCNAGVGFQFYEKENIESKDSWRSGLVTYKYYDTFEDAVNAEHERLADDDS